MKPEPIPSYDLYDCCNYIQGKVPILKGVNFDSWYARSMMNGSNQTCFPLNYMEDIKYVPYEDWMENSPGSSDFATVEDFRLMQAFYIMMESEFGENSYMRIDW